MGLLIHNKIIIVRYVVLVLSRILLLGSTLSFCDDMTTYVPTK